MAGLFRAYGQTRRGSAPWRTPFLIPLGDIVPPFIQGSSNVAIDAGAGHPDLLVGLVITSIDHYPTIGAQFHVKPQPGSVLTDFTLRMVLLMTDGSGHEPSFVDGGALTPAAKFAVLHYRVPPGQNLANDVTISLLSDFGNLDPADTKPNPSPLTQPFPAGTFRVDRVAIVVKPDPLDVAGGMITGPMVAMAGVETNYNSLLHTGYSETTRQVHGIDLAWIEPGAPPSAPKPPSATWLEATATGGSSLGVQIFTPTVGDAPPGAPTVEPVNGGSLRPGAYRYRTSWLHSNGNESSPSTQSVVAQVDAAKRTVRVSGFPAPPPAPNPDLTGIAVSKRRIYRTDCDTTVDSTPAELGARGDDVLVAELAPGVATYDDAGPADPSAAQKIRRDYMAILYTSPNRLDITGSIRMVSGAADDRYGGSVVSAPRTLRVLYRPGVDPTLLWSADDATPEVRVQMPGFGTPYGTGLFAVAEGVPRRFALDFVSLGSEFFGLGVAGDTATAPPAGADAAEPVGRVGVRLGPTAPPAEWPEGEADVAAELADAESGAAGGLVALTGLRRGGVRSGGRLWSDRDTQKDTLDISALFAEVAAYRDRTLRFARRGGSRDTLPELAVTGHFVPDVVHARAHFPSAGTTTLQLDSRVRFLRAAFRSTSFAPVDPAHPDAERPVVRSMDGTAFLDDTTDSLHAELGDKVTVATKWPVRAGGTVRSRKLAGAPVDLTLWPDVVVPADVSVETEYPITPTLGAPGLSGRLAMANGSDRPIAVRATPQVKVLTHGDAEDAKGLRALTVRVIGVRSALVPEEVSKLSDGSVLGVVDVNPTLEFDPGRSNGSFRAEMWVRERRVAFEPTLHAPADVRSWLRARTAHLPRRLVPQARLTATATATPGKPDVAFVGATLNSSEAWGEGVAWVEPGFVWESKVAGDLGDDKGIGLVTAGFDRIPENVEMWLLDKGAALDGHVPEADRLPGVGPFGADWEAGGVALRVDGSIHINGFQLALPGGSGQECRNDDGPDHAVRHGQWTEAIAPFIKLDPSAGGLKELLVWSAGAPQTPADPNAPEPDPCNPPPAGPDRDTAMGWRIHDDLKVTMAVRLYDLDTPSGKVVARWWTMPTATETWGGDVKHTGEWELQQELQMKDYGMASVALYPRKKTDNPFGDWEGGNGDWWLRQRGGLDVPLFLFFGPGISSGDVFMGNVGGGFHMPGTNGIYSTLPKLFIWSYP